MEGLSKRGDTPLQGVIRVAYKIKDWKDFSGKLREMGLSLRQLRAIQTFISRHLRSISLGLKHLDK